MRQPSLKEDLRSGKLLYGLFCSAPAAITTEAVSGVGFDFVVFDAEHTPTSIPTIYTQLLALAGSGTAPVVRLATNEPVAIKHLLDLGVTTLMVPDVNSPEEAARAVRYTRYPPDGVRGIAGTVRATNFGRDAGYYAAANDRACLAVQAESPAAIAQLDEIARTPGVDVVFFGPNDLAARSGYLGQPSHPAIVEIVEDGIRRVCRQGKIAGVLTDETMLPRYLAAGATMVAVGSELGLMVRAAEGLLGRLQRLRTPSSEKQGR